MIKKIKLALVFILILEMPCVAGGYPETALRAPVGTAIERLDAVDIMQVFEERAGFVGGKASWDELLDELGPKIGFKTCPTIRRFTIQEIWDKFIDANKGLADKGNALISQDVMSMGRVSEETLDKLQAMILEFTFPK